MVAAHRSDRRLAAWPDTGERGQLPNRRRDHLLVHELLHFVQDGLALLVVEFGRLLRVQLVDVGITAVGLSAALDDKGFETGGAPKAALAPIMRPLSNFFSV